MKERKDKNIMIESLEIGLKTNIFLHGLMNEVTHQVSRVWK